jgi:lysophospholipase L1-like esterase
MGTGVDQIFDAGPQATPRGDETAHRTVARIESDLSAMYAGARARGARVVAITVAPWGGFSQFNPRRAQATHELNAWLRAGPKANAIDRVVDAFALLACDDPERLCPAYEIGTPDGLHFGKAGHAVLAAALYAAEFHDCR